MKANRKPKHRLLALLFSCVLVALGAIGSVGASSASACSATAILGQGSSLQKISQELWKTGSGCKVTYTSSGSAAGLEAFGVKEAGAFAKFKDAFIGTDDAPNGTFSTGQLGEMETAAKGVSTEEQDLVIPVAQAAIAVVVHPPTGCSISTISNANLQKAFAGTGKTTTEPALWKDIGGTPAASCEGEVKRVVRLDGSGTTYQFKHYLFEINKTALTCVTVGSKLWTDLQEEPTRNVEWPESCTGHTLSEVVLPVKTGGGGLTEEVAKVEGSIGYANLGDARARKVLEPTKISWLKVENQFTTFNESPGTSTGEPSTTEGNANCKKASYGTHPTTVGPDQNWSGVYGGHPGSGTEHNEKYPICTLTWDVALVNYELAGLTLAEGTAAKEFFKYVTAETEGQAALVGKDYGQVEEVVSKYAAEIAALVSSKP